MHDFERINWLKLNLENWLSLKDVLLKIYILHFEIISQITSQKQQKHICLGNYNSRPKPKLLTEMILKRYLIIYNYMKYAWVVWV